MGREDMAAVEMMMTRKEMDEPKDQRMWQG
jgi:hypothetical protein